MNLRDFVWIVVHRGWVIVLFVALALGGAYEYSHRQPRIYEATATVFAHPSGVTTPGDFNSDISLLTYGTLTQTFSSLAQSHSMLVQATKGMDITQTALANYTVTVDPIGQTTILEVTVDGPGRTLVTSVANSLARATARAISTYYHVFALTPLDDATVPKAPIRPTTTKNLEYGGAAGLIIGFVVAILSLTLPRMLRASQWEDPRGVGGPPPARSLGPGVPPQGTAVVVAIPPSAPARATAGTLRRADMHRPGAAPPAVPLVRRLNASRTRAAQGAPADSSDAASQTENSGQSR